MLRTSYWESRVAQGWGGLLCVGLALWAVSTGVMASDPSPLFDIFERHEGDMSWKVLKGILGDFDNLTTPYVSPLLAGAFTIFNLGVLIFASVLFAYTAVVGVLQSAHDGQFMGKNWSGLWIPVRFSIGVGLLIPTTTGLCLAQIGMLWVLGQGVGLANNMWVRAVEQYSTQSHTLMMAQMAGTGEVQEALMGLMANELCVAALNHVHGADSHGVQTQFQTRISTPDSLWAAITGKKVSHVELQWGSINGKGNPKECGTLRVPKLEKATYDRFFGNPNTAGVLNSDKHLLIEENIQFGNRNTEALSGLLSYYQIQGFLVAGEAFRAKAAEWMAFSGTQPPVSGQEIWAALDDEILRYYQSIGPKVSELLEKQNAILMTRVIDQAKGGGWFTAGTWYYQLQIANENIATTVANMPTPSANARIGAFLAAEDGEMGRLEADKAKQFLVGSGLPPEEAERIGMMLKAAEEYRKKTQQPLGYALNLTPPGAGVDPETRHGGFGGKMAEWTRMAFGVDSDLRDDWSLQWGHDPQNPAPPLVQLRTVGKTLDNVATGVLVAAGAMAGVSMLTEKTPAGNVGKVVTKIPFVKTLLDAVKGAFHVILILGLALFAFGVILAYWLPMLPFINWIGGLVGWVLATLEMLIAAPVWLAAHLHPEGEGVSGRYAASGYMILLELLLRPALMILGLIVSILSADALLDFISGQYLLAFASVQFDDIFKSPVGWVMKILIYCVLCWMVVNFCFKAINEVPNKVMSWIGGHAGAHSDMGESLGENAKLIIMAGIHKTTGMAGNFMPKGQPKPGDKPRSKA
jgi:conjugal transfer/type IV secretion protein DotA/TraY